METKRQSVLISSLYGYSVSLNRVPIQEVEKMIEVHNKSISSNKFWDLVKTIILIKTAFFILLTSIIDANIILENDKKRTVT